MVTQERLKELLSYDPDTGDFRWRVSRKRISAGSVASSLDADGYIRIKIDQKTYKAHRLAFLYVTGSFPENEVDHIDLNKTNNKFENLREATKQQNMRNTKTRRDNKCGFKGVYYSESRKRFIAQARVSGKTIYIGSFTTPIAAHSAYAARAHDLFGDFARAS